MGQPPSLPPQVSHENLLWLESHLNRIRQLIIHEAQSIASESGSGLEELDIAEAAKKFAPGKKFPADPSFEERLKASMSGITVVSAVLALVFGLLGIFLQHQGKEPKEYFDIVKLFAGAIIGSTGAGIAAGPRRR